MPFYLLIVGDPDTIPYRFQYQLDVLRAVGRIDFGDDIDAYNRYARSVVEAETSGLKLPRRMTFFGVENEDDRATQLIREKLIEPLYEQLTQTIQEDEQQWADPQERHKAEVGLLQWTIDHVIGEAAKKSKLASLLG